MKQELEQKFYDEFPGWFDECQFGFECIPENTYLLGNGNKLVQDYKVNDNIIFENGRTKVLKTIKQQYTGELLIIHAAGLLPLKVTPNHPILTVYENDKFRPNKNNIRLEFKNAIDLMPKLHHSAGNYLVFPKLNIQEDDINNTIDLLKYRKSNKGCSKIEHLELSNEIAWLMGLYTAEGSISNVGFQISLHEKETDIVNKIKNIIKKIGDYSIHIKYSKFNKGIVLTVSAKLLSRMLNDLCGHGAENKKIPDIILFNTNLNILESFLNGYIDGDGTIYKSYGSDIGVKACTVSKFLAIQLQVSYGRLNKFARISSSPAKVSRIMNRICNCKEKYSISVNNAVNKDILELETCFLIPIRKIEKEFYEGCVYNFETESHTYLVNNIITHNCSDGWFDLLWNMCVELKKLGFNTGFSQIKEKFSTLRAYANGATDEQWKVIEKAEELSETTCEECGQPGKIRGKSWLYLRCDKCYEELLEKWNNYNKQEETK